MNREKWFAVNTNPKCEGLVHDLLRREDFEVFLPKIINRKRAVEVLFPGYLFVRLDLDSPAWVKIKYLHGVRKILSFGNMPLPMPEAIIAAIKNRDYTHKAVAWRPGDKVAFTKGPFAGLEGKFTGEVSGKERVKVLLTAVQQAITVEVEATELSKV